MPNANPSPIQLLKSLFVPSLDGYRGLILHVPMPRQGDKEDAELAGILMMHVAIGCKATINFKARTFDVWIPEGISTTQIQLWMLRHPFEVRA